MNTVRQYHDSAEGYLYDFAVNLQTLRYLYVLSLLKDTQNDVLEYMQVGECHGKSIFAISLYWDVFKM